MDIEEGMLSWTDSMQWSLNRINNSQLTVLNSNSVTQYGQKFKVCKFYNEGSCTNENHHGIYKHYCAYCHKQGRSLMHHECRCVSRSSGCSQEQKAATRKKDLGQTSDPDLITSTSYDFQQPVNRLNVEHVDINLRQQFEINNSDHLYEYITNSFNDEYDICKINDTDSKYELCFGDGVELNSAHYDKPV